MKFNYVTSTLNKSNLQICKLGDEMLFNAIIEKDENGYFAYVPTLKGCVSQGETYEEALANIIEATELYIESLQNEEKRCFFTNNTIIAPIEVALNV